MTTDTDAVAPEHAARAARPPSAPHDVSLAGLAGHERGNLRLLLIGQTTSVIGTQTTAVALPLLATGLAGASSLAISLIAAARYLPFLFLAIPAGILADRYNPRSLMIFSDVARLALLTLLPALYFTHTLSVAVIIGVVLLVTTARVLFDLSLNNHIINSFSERSWLTVNSRIDAFTEAGGLTGPPMAGVIAGAIGAVWALVLDAVTYVTSLATLFRLRDAPPEPAREHAAPDAPGATALSTRAAVAMIWRHAVLRHLLLGGAVSNFALMALQGISVVYMIRDLHLSSLVTGLIVACSGVGSALGAGYAPRLMSGHSLRTLILLTGPAMTLGPLSLLVESSCAPAPFLGYAVMGFSIALISVCGRRYRQGRIPAETFGVVSGVYGTANMGMLPLGAVTGGIVSDLAGFNAVLYISALGFLLGATSFALALRSGLETER
jgi:MFS family permease